MDVKGAKALSERLAEAARNVDPPPAKAVVSKQGRKPVRLEAMTREQREIVRKQIDTLMRERLAGEPSPRGPRHKGNASRRAQKVKSRL